MQFLETYPSKHLSQYVKSFWRMSCDLPNNTDIITRDIPNGDFHVLFNLGTAFTNIQNDHVVVYNKGIIKGQQSKYLSFVQTNGFDVVGVSFYPWGFYPFTNIPSKEFYNQTINVNDVFDSDIEEMLWGLAFNKQVDILESHLLEKLRNYRSRSFFIELIASQITENKGRVNIHGILKKYKISHKHLTRCFQELVGISPKKLAGLCRVNAVIDDIITANDKPDWMDIVVRNHYYDHSHMIKDFKQVVGLTPEAYITKNDSLYQRYSGHLSTLDFSTVISP